MRQDINIYEYSWTYYPKSDEKLPCVGPVVPSRQHDQ